MFSHFVGKKLFFIYVILVVSAFTAHAALQGHLFSRSAQIPDGDWPGYNLSLNSQRFSPLGEINRSNVGSLKVQCVYDLKQKVSFQTGPVAENGVVFFTTENDTYAINGETCAEIWKYHREFTSTGALALHVNRGAMVAKGRVYRGSNDGYLLALDAKTGKLIWEAKAANPAIGETLPAAPVVWNGMVFIGQAGGDNAGVRGRMMAFRESDGQKLWSFDLVPMMGPGSETWPESTAQVPRTGGATWSSYTVDEAEGALLVPVGNAAPDFLISARPGANLYTDSVVILDAKSGHLRTYYQLVKNDTHDWDIASPPVLLQKDPGVKMLAQAGKDGLFCPGSQGGSEWNGAAYDPGKHILFVGAVDWCTTVRLSPNPLPPLAKPGDPFTGAVPDAPFGTMDPKSHWKGRLTAFNVEDGKVLWRFDSDAPVLAAVTPTAGGLVFAAGMNGHFRALNSETGEVLYTSLLGDPIGGGIISYWAAGRQRIAVAVGMKSVLWELDPTSSRIVIFGLE